MHHPARHLRLLRLAGTASVTVCVAALALAGGCKNEQPKQNQTFKVNYPDLGDKPNVPAFMKGTIWELANRTNDEPYAAATYGLVGRLRGTGDSTVSLPVRQWMQKQMLVHGYGQTTLPGYASIGPEQILRNPGYAIVRVDGMIPPGAREGDRFDVQVSALPGNKTSSLSGGILFEADLTRLRGNSPDLEGVAILAKAKGPILVNPAYALADAVSASGQAKASLRTGIVMGEGLVMSDRPIVLRLRHPGYPMARAIETRINQRYQKIADHPRKNGQGFQVAAAMDQGLVEAFVPKAFNGDWEHFVGVVEHLYLNGSPAFNIAKAKELTDAATRPDAPLRDISYALEGIGEPALQYVLPLMVHPDPSVAFAMARAAVFIGDDSGAAQDTLVRMARADDHPFQLDAIQTIGALPASPERNQKMRDVLESRNTTARIEAYKVLVRNKDQSSLYSKVINEKFILDVVPAAGEPILYASRSGLPRIALIGPKPTLKLPVLFTAMEQRLMISSPNAGRNVTIFFRDDARKEPLRMPSRPDIGEVVARLGGEGAPEEDRFDFTYGEIVAVLQSLAQAKKVVAAGANGDLTLAPFIFEQPRDAQGPDDAAPAVEDSRPNTGGAARAAERAPRGTDAG